MADNTSLFPLTRAFVEAAHLSRFTLDGRDVTKAAVLAELDAAEPQTPSAEREALFPSLAETRDATLVEGEHLWIAWSPSLRPDRPMICCRWCGIVKQRKGEPKACRGIVKVTLR